MSVSFDFGSSFHARSGTAPEPFDAINGTRLAGPEGSHPLHAVSPEELVRPGRGPISGEIVVDGPARVGDMIAGVIRLSATDRVDARGAVLRLVGLRLDEVRRSTSHEDADGHSTRTESWVEVDGSLFAKDAFTEPAIPPAMSLGQAFETRFAIPAPRLGPPTAHLGEAIVAWALEVRWDIAMGDDHFVAAYLPVAQHPDLIRAGVGKQGGMSVLDAVAVGGGVIGVTTPLPAPAGSEIAVNVHWPSASGGSVGRVELQRRTNAPNGVTGVIASVPVDPKALQGGIDIRLAVPDGTAPSFDGAGLESAYVIRVLVDRRLRPDAAIERPVAIV